MTVQAIRSVLDDPDDAKTAPTSFVQEQLWIVEQLTPNRALGTESIGLRLRGSLVTSALERALREIVRRHEILRTVFPVVEGRPLQRVLDDLSIDLDPPIDRGGFAEADRRSVLDETARQLVEQPVDLATGPLFRCGLVRLADDDHALVVAVHHLVCDGWSAEIIVDELKLLYEEFLAGRSSPLTEPELQYADFAVWERKLLASGIVDDDIRYWTERLEDAPPLLSLPSDRPRPAARGMRGRRDEFDLGDARLARDFDELCRKHGVTTFMAALAAFAALVSRYTHRTDFLVGTLVANRQRPELETMVGQFANTVPLRLDVGGDPSFSELVSRCRDRCLEALDHAHLALEKIVELVRPGRGTSHNALIQHLVLVKQMPVREGLFGDLELTSFETSRDRGRLDTIVELEATPTSLRAWVEYDLELFDAETVAQLMAHYARILEQWTADPALPVSRLELVETAELDAEPTIDESDLLQGALELRSEDRVVQLGGPGGHATAAVARAVASTGASVVDAVGDATVLHAPPRTLAGLVPEDFPCADRILVTGREPVSQDLVQAWTGGGRSVVWAYVDDEAGLVTACRWRARSDDTIDAEPLCRGRAFVLDDHLQPVPDGVSGRLYLRDTPLWRTGDMARRRRDGTIEVLGPETASVEIDGYRIDPAAVEEVLGEHPDVEDAVVVARGDPGEMRLDAYVTGAALPPIGELRSFVARRLPDALVPATLCRLESIPRDAAGGADLDTLHAADSSVPDAGDPLLVLVGELWRDVMELDNVSPDDDFFELGGHSMLSAWLMGRIQESLQVEVPLRTLFENPTPRELTAEIRRMHPELDDVVAALASMPETTFSALLEGIAAERLAAAAGPPAHVPLSYSQLQLWLMEKLRPGAVTYTIPFSFRIHGPFDPALFQESLDGVVARHDALRTAFVDTADGPIQVVEPPRRSELPVTDLTAIPGHERFAELYELEQACSYHVFDLEHPPLFHVHVVRLEPEEHAVLLTFHHLVVDEVSVTVLVRELSELYRALLEGRSPRLPELPFQFVDYTLHERERLQGENLERLEAFWRRELRNAPTLDVPTDRPRPAELTFVGDWVERRVPRELFDAMARLARKAHVTPFVVLLAATATLLSRSSDQDDFVLGAPSENRTLARSELLVGCFLNVLPLRVDCGGDPTMLEFLKRMRDTLLRAYDHQELPISRIVDAVRPPRASNRLPLVQASCELQLGGWLPFDLPGCTVDYRLVAHGTARYELAFHGIAKEDHLLLALELNTDLWDRATGARLLAELESVLRAMIATPALRLSEVAAGASAEARVQ